MLMTAQQIRCQRIENQLLRTWPHIHVLMRTGLVWSKLEGSEEEGGLQKYKSEEIKC
jgi:hypothetical protein